MASGEHEDVLDEPGLQEVLDASSLPGDQAERLEEVIAWMEHRGIMSSDTGYEDDPETSRRSVLKAIGAVAGAAVAGDTAANVYRQKQEGVYTVAEPFGVGTHHEPAAAAAARDEPVDARVYNVMVDDDDTFDSDAAVQHIESTFNRPLEMGGLGIDVDVTWKDIRLDDMDTDHATEFRSFIEDTSHTDRVGDEYAVETEGGPRRQVIDNLVHRAEEYVDLPEQDDAAIAVFVAPYDDRRPSFDFIELLGDGAFDTLEERAEMAWNNDNFLFGTTVHGEDAGTPYCVVPAMDPEPALRNKIVHEFGHKLGLDHTTVGFDVMSYAPSANVLSAYLQIPFSPESQYTFWEKIVPQYTDREPVADSVAAFVDDTYTAGKSKLYSGIEHAKQYLSDCSSVCPEP